MPVILIKTFLPVAVGAVSGYLYYKFVGCVSGACPITSNPFTAVLYGAGMGYLISRLWS